MAEVIIKNLCKDFGKVKAVVDLNLDVQNKEIEDIASLKAKIAETIDLAVGGIDNIIKAGETVLIKPNLAFQAPPESFSVVDPRVIEALQHCK